MKHDDVKALEQDSVAYARAMESMYNCLVVLRLQPAGTASRYSWAVYAVAYLDDVEVPQNGAIQRSVSYPSMHHKTFGGAALKALMDLEEALRAYTTLQGIKITTG